MCELTAVVLKSVMGVSTSMVNDVEDSNACGPSGWQSGMWTVPGRGERKDVDDAKQVGAGGCGWAYAQSQPTDSLPALPSPPLLLPSPPIPSHRSHPIDPMPYEAIPHDAMPCHPMSHPRDHRNRHGHGRKWRVSSSRTRDRSGGQGDARPVAAGQTRTCGGR